MEKELSKNPVTKEGKLPFTNSAIQNWVPIYGDSKDKYKKISFDVSRDIHLKGLRLRHSKSTKKKDFILVFWFNKKQLRYNLVTFNIKKFDTRKVSDKLYKIVKEHINDKGLWIKNPKITEKETERENFTIVLKILNIYCNS